MYPPGYVCKICIYVPTLSAPYILYSSLVLNFVGFDISLKQAFTCVHLDCTMTETFYSDTLGCCGKNVTYVVLISFVKMYTA